MNIYFPNVILNDFQRNCYESKLSQGMKPVM